MSAESIVESSWTPAFSRGIDGSITEWNQRAEKLLAIPARSAVGKKCWKVIAGRDVYGNDYCCENCATWRMALSDRLVHPYRLSICENDGWTLDLRVSILAITSPDGPGIIHLLQSVIDTGIVVDDSEEVDSEWNELSCTQSAFTRRELQVLRHLAAGNNTNEIASQLLICRATVHNHISNCLEKLKVHSRVEAISVARRLSLV